MNRTRGEPARQVSARVFTKSGAVICCWVRGVKAVKSSSQSVGGSGGSSIIAAAMQALPVGVPKLLVSTMASGDTRPYVGTSDVAMLH